MTTLQQVQVRVPLRPPAHDIRTRSFFVMEVFDNLLIRPPA
jgi:hypothetical protein